MLLRRNHMHIEGKEVSLYSSGHQGAPIVILNSIGGDADDAFREISSLSRKPFSLAVVSSLDWNADLSPWPSSPVFRNGDGFAGRADDYLDLLVSEIVPRIVREEGTAPEYIALAGYSLAGLFSLYAMYRTTVFSRFASVSGSLWFPGFCEYAMSHDMQTWPDAVYISLGDREARTHNPIMQSVEKESRVLVGYYSRAGIKTFFGLNEGNHFQDAEKRTAKGVAWLLEQA